VGHAHIDTAWLWPIRETKRKCLRTFSTTLRLMEREPGYRFLCSQAQQYAWLEETSPELFQQVKARVAEGCWEPGGAMWIEPDCNVPSGESLIRQILHADRYWRAKFGDTRGRQRFLYLPDTFGFPPQLPQIMRLAGLDTFITNKLHWNDTNVFPHTTFIWRGLDGSEVVGHNTPGMDYNALLTPRELIRGEKTHRNKDLSFTSDGREPFRGPARWLQPFGFGDGGGGPTDWNLLNADLAANSDSLPRVRLSTVNDFCDALHADIAAARQRDPSAVAVHEGELYLELHRGTLTTHARIKQANAECEELLRQAEILTFAGPTRLPANDEKKAKADLDRAWKLLLLNQFHDILPGSSIGWVYQDAERDYAAIRAIAQPLIERGMAHWAAHVRPLDSGESVCLFNLSNGTPPACTTIDGQIVATRGVPPLGVGVIDRTAKPATCADLSVTGDRLLTREGLRVHGNLLSVEFDRAGRIIELDGFDEGPPRDRIAALPRHPSSSPARVLNRLALYEDHPRLWDAWDFDAEHVEKVTFLDDDCEHQIVHDTPERVAIRFTRSFGRGSRITQTFTILADTRHIEIDTEIDWREEHRLLRVHGPIAAASESIRLGTQFGERSVSVARNSSAERAAFELPFHHFIADPHSGLTWVFSDRHGASIRDRTLGITLLRSPRYPDPAADVGLHRFRYAIAADPSFAAWGCIGQSLLAPPRLGPAPTGSASHPHVWAPLEGAWSVAAIKPAEDDDRLIVRLINASPHERARSPILWRLPVARVEAVDLLERPMAMPGFEHDAANNRTILPARPFGIVTLAVTRAD
jgi:alpha-mannosidase